MSFFALALSFGASAARAQTWTSLGPVNVLDGANGTGMSGTCSGAVYFNGKTDGSSILVTGQHNNENGGIRMTNDGGATWTTANNGLGDLHVTAIVADLNSPTKFFVSTANAIYSTSNNAAKWQLETTTPGATDYSLFWTTIAGTPTLVAGTQGGIEYRTEASSTWTLQPVPSGESIYMLEATQSGSSTIFYVTMQSYDFYKVTVTNGTWTWTKLPLQSPTVSIDPNNPLHLLLIDPANDYNPAQSTDGGETETDFKAPPADPIYSFESWPIDFDPRDTTSKTIWVGGDGEAWISTDAGNSWTAVYGPVVSTEGFTSPTIGPDVQRQIFVPGTSTTLICSDQGLEPYNPATKTFSGNLAVWARNNISVSVAVTHPSNTTTPMIASGLWDWAQVGSFDGGQTWGASNYVWYNKDGSGNPVMEEGIQTYGINNGADGNSHQLHADVYNYYYSNDGGETFTQSTFPPLSGTDKEVTVYDTLGVAYNSSGQATGTYWIGVNNYDVNYNRLNGIIMTSPDYGATWTNLSTPPFASGEMLTGLAVDPGDATHLVVSGSQKLYQSTNTGKTWTSSALPARIPFSLISFKPGTSGSIAALNQSGTVYLTQNGGNAWTAPSLPIAANLLPVSVSYSPSGKSLALVATSQYPKGVDILVSNNDGTSWTNITGDEPATMINRVAWDGSDLYLATSGFGVQMLANVDNIHGTAQAITFPTIPTQRAGGSLSLDATSGSELPVTFMSFTPQICLVSETTLQLLAHGSCTVVASQHGNTSYAAATPATQRFTINFEPQTIAFGAVPTQKTGVPFTPDAKASSGLPVSFTSLTPKVCTASGSTVNPIAVGMCSVTASQAGNSAYFAARSVTQSFKVILSRLTTTTLAINPSANVSPGQTVTLTATITTADSSTATGTGVQFYDNGVPIGPAQAYANGSSSYQDTNLAAGDHSFTATFNSTGAYLPSTSPAVPLLLQLVQAVGSAYPTLTETVTITNAGTLGQIYVLTTGQPNLDYTYVTGGTCSVGTAYAVNATCTVSYSFTPKAPGQRLGAVQLVASDAITVLGTTLLSGTGTAAAAIFPGNTGTVALGNGFNNSLGVAVDAAGNVYVADYGNSAVKEIVAVGGSTSSSSKVLTLGSRFSGFSGPSAVAVDGAGNVYVADYNTNTVKEIVAVGGSISGNNPTILTLGNGFYSPLGVAVDAEANVYVADSGNNAVKEIVALGGSTSSSSTILTLGGGFLSPEAVAVDGAGNVYVADTGNAAVKEIVAVEGMVPVSNVMVDTLGSGFSEPQGVAVDSAGNVYVTDGDTNAVTEIVAVGGSIPTANPTMLTLGSGFNGPYSVALDGAGNVYVADSNNFAADSNNNAVKEIPLTTPPSLSFPSTGVGSTSGPQTVLLQNAGNGALTFPMLSSGSNPVTGSGFVLDSSTTCPQVASGGTTASLAAGSSCNEAVNFQPTQAGINASSLVMTDNSLGAADSNGNGVAVQAISLTGTATASRPTIAWASPAAITYGSALSSAQLDATASVPGSFVYSPAAGSVLAAGANQTLSVTFTPTDTTDYTPTTATTTLTVNPAPATPATSLSR